MSAPHFPNEFNDGVKKSSGTDAGRIAEVASADLGQVADEVKTQAAAIGEEAKAQLGEVADKAKGMAAEQKDLLASRITGVADALQKVAGELDDSGEASAGYVRFIADGASQLTSAIRDNDVDQLISMAQDFGRKQPVAFLGAAALLGFAASRFALASASRASVGSQSNMVRAEPLPSYADATGGKDGGL